MKDILLKIFTMMIMREPILRQKLHLTLEQMAVYLGVSPSLLAMSEKCKRQLPAEASKKLAELEAEYYAPKAKKHGSTWLALQADIKIVDKETAVHIKREAGYHRLKAQQHEKKLDQLNDKLQQLEQWLNIIDSKLDTLPNTKAAKNDRKWLENQQLATTEKLLKTSTLMAKMNFKINLWQAIAGIHEEAYKKMVGKK